MNLVKNRLVVFFFLNLFILSDIIFYHSLVNEFVLLTFVTYLIFILIFEIIILYFAFKKTKLFSIILLTIFTSINFISFKLVNYSFINTQGNFSKLLILIFFIFVFYIISKRIFDKKSNFFIIFSVLLISLSSSVSIFFKESTYKQNKNFLNYSTVPNFEKKPDIFLLGIDGFIPESLIKKFYNYNLEQNINKENFLDIRNSFATKTPTEFSWTNILNISQNHFKLNKQSFAGHQNNLLFEIFRRNGYTIQTGFSKAFFAGNIKGEYVDQYFIYDSLKRYRRSEACFDNSGFLYVPKYLLLCRSNSINKTITDLITFIFPSLSKHSSLMPEKDFLLPFFKKKNNPRLFLYHSLEYTNHTPSAYDHQNIKERQDFSKYYIDAYKKSFVFFDELVRYVNKNNPNAIVLIFGDHGSFIHIKKNDKYLTQTQFISSDELDYLLDRHAIRQLYLKTKNSCIYENKYSQNYSTTSREIANIIFCLSSDKANVQRLFQTFNEKRYSSPDHGHEEIFIDWKDYLYE